MRSMVEGFWTVGAEESLRQRLRGCHLPCKYRGGESERNVVVEVGVEGGGLRALGSAAAAGAAAGDEILTEVTAAARTAAAFTAVEQH